MKLHKSFYNLVIPIASIALIDLHCRILWFVFMLACVLFIPLMRMPTRSKCKGMISPVSGKIIDLQVKDSEISIAIKTTPFLHCQSLRMILDSGFLKITSNNCLKVQYSDIDVVHFANMNMFEIIKDNKKDNLYGAFFMGGVTIIKAYGNYKTSLTSGQTAIDGETEILWKESPSQ